MAKIGTSEWWTETADKVLNLGLNVIQSKLQGVDNTRGQTVYQSASGSMQWMPYAIGAAVIGGIVLILAKR